MAATGSTGAHTVHAQPLSLQVSGTALVSRSGAGECVCPACATAADLEQHRDATAGAWSVRRGVLNFAILVASQNCPAYVAATPVRESLEDA